MRTLTIFLTIFAVQSVAAAAYQEAEDAGAFPGWAESAALAGSLDLIEGRLAHAFDVDLFRVVIDDPVLFSARVASIAAGAPDPQLFVFDNWGRGLLANDNWLGSPLAQIPAGNLRSPAGVYLIGIAPSGANPLAPSGEIIFSTTSNGLLRPTGLAQFLPVFDWTRNLLAIGGSYAIELTGVSGIVPLPGIPGDYNQNGAVDAADYTVWRDHLGSDTALPNDDSPGVGPDDYARWKTHFGDSTGAAAFDTPGLVPEPSAVGLLVMAVVFGRIPRRRRAT